MRSNTGVRPTDAGAALLGEARVLARHDQALRTMTRYTGGGGGIVRIGIPLELPSRLLSPALAGPAGAEGIALDASAGLQWAAFPRSDSPAWYDELTAILRSHGLDPGAVAPEGQRLIGETRLAAVSAGRAFAPAPADWSQPIPEGVAWSPLIGHPLIRRTWAVWPAGSRRQDLGRLIAAFEQPADD
ncbi:hypothetical protein ABZ876_23430 [Streptomyces sp. NPDC046931]|uniref:hypothetical protein n=1 Tax=Streptomyces sp. NPDC046931 TaxID=3154806 RepID=UPI0034034673